MGRTARDSAVEMTEIVLPEDTNARGTIFGGRVLALVDKCAAVAALRHARGEVVTVSFDSVEFRHTVKVGNILVLHGRLNAAFGSSMEIDVEVLAEDPATGVRTQTTRALVTMVALSPDGKPARVPPLLALDDEDRRRAEEAGLRRARRLAERP